MQYEKWSLKWSDSVKMAEKVLLDILTEQYLQTEQK